MSNSPLAQLAANGVSIWLDDLSRSRIVSGGLRDLITNRSVSGVTTNPTIFAGALAKGEGYQAQVAELAAAGATAEQESSRSPPRMLPTLATFSPVSTSAPMALMAAFQSRLSQVLPTTQKAPSSRPRNFSQRSTART
jgi:malic enzyme